jgi:hypothetical protein
MIRESFNQKCRDTKRKALKKEEKVKEEEETNYRQEREEKKKIYSDSDCSD